MAPHLRVSHPLRLVTQRLESTSVEQLPYVATQLTETLLDCEKLLRTPADQLSKGADDSVILHKYKTQISTLLQTKSISGRWAGVLLVKATVEAGGIEIVQSSSSWIRSLLGYLGRPDPSSTKKAVIITLTRIFDITHGNAGVVREITTPTLPTFLTSCLNCISTGTQTNRAVKAGHPLLKVVLQAFIELLPHHPSTFRPFVNQIKPILSALVCPTPSASGGKSNIRHTQITKSVTGLAQRLHALLPHCAPKTGSSDQWNRAVVVICEHANQTANQIFRALIEESTESRSRKNRSNKDFSAEVADNLEDELSLTPWTGITAGSERLSGLLELLQAYLATTSPQSLSVPIALIWSLIERMLSVFGPTGQDDEKDNYTRFKPEADRTEREELWRNLQQIHRAALDLTEVLLTRLKVSAITFAHIVLDRLVWTFTRNMRHQNIRTSSYEVCRRLIEQIGPSLSKAQVDSLEAMILQACEDLSAGTIHYQDTSRPDGAKSILHKQNLERVTNASATFLTEAVSHTLPEVWSAHLRRAIDRTSILMQDRDTMIACVLHPPHSSSRTMPSILPFLARAHSEYPTVEAIIRPRLPVIRTGQRKSASLYSDEQSDSEETAKSDAVMDTTIGSTIPDNATSHDRFQSSIAQASSRVSAPNIPIVAPLPPPPPDIQSPKRLRDNEQQELGILSAEESIQPDPKRARVVEPVVVEATKVASPPTEVLDRGKSVEVYAAQLLMEGHVIQSSKPQDAGTIEEVVEEVNLDDSDDSGSEIPSIHMDSDLDDEVDDDDDDG